MPNHQDLLEAFQGDIRGNVEEVLPWLSPELTEKKNLEDFAPVPLPLTCHDTYGLHWSCAGLFGRMEQLGILNKVAELANNLVRTLPWLGSWVWGRPL